MTAENDLPAGARAATPMPQHVQARRADLLRTGHRAAAAVQDASRQCGIVNRVLLRGRMICNAVAPTTLENPLCP